MNIDTKFRVEGEDQGYKLNVGGYSGTAGDDMAGTMAHGSNNGMKFSTQDRDNDLWGTTHCAQKFKQGWWFRR